ncbi:hypothetical protein NX059_003984 [Plenodomus lindquistii]|nr:hypothetical protein NX059_003984 [Plenodomus lindquistii]
MPDALNPTGAAQPTNSTPYTNSANPITKDPTESSQSFDASSNAATTDTRLPTKQASDAAGLRNAKYGEGAGIHGAPAGEEGKGLTSEDVGRHKELDGEQMAAPGEGKVAAAVRQGGEGMGGGGSQPDLVSDLDRKKEEQREAREAIDQSKEGAMKAGGAAGQTGGPANPVDRQAGGNYPN